MTPTFSASLFRCIIGLGNPGPSYQNTRHNIGFFILDFIAEKQNAAWSTERSVPLEWTIVHSADEARQKIILVKPLTYMNESGKVAFFVKKHVEKTEQIATVYDELESPFGNIKTSFATSHKGHNGVKSLIGHLGTNFWRIRVGISRPTSREAEEVSNYVLGKFSREEQSKLPEIGEHVASLLNLS